MKGELQHRVFEDAACSYHDGARFAGQQSVSSWFLNPRPSSRVECRFSIASR